MLSTASPTVSVLPRAVEDAEELDEALEELDEPEEAHPARAIAAAAASRKPLLFLVMIRFLFMIRSFGRWGKDFYAGGHVRDHGLVVADEQVGDRQVALQVS